MLFRPLSNTLGKRFQLVPAVLLVSSICAVLSQSLNMLQTFVSYLEHDKRSSYLSSFIFVLFYHLPILFQPNALDLSLISFILSPG